MPITKIEYTDTSHTSANYTYDDGTVESAPYPAQNGPTREAAEAFLAAGGTVTPFPVPTLADRKVERIAELAAIRYGHECKGYTWTRPTTTDTFVFATDRESRGNISGERTAAKELLRRSGDKFKCYVVAENKVRGVEFTNEEIITIGESVRNHVSDCFNLEESYRVKIEAATTKADLDAIDLTVGWP